MELFVIAFHIGQLGDTRATPRRPEVDEDHFAPVGSPIEIAAAERFAFNRHELAGEPHAARQTFVSLCASLNAGIIRFRRQLAQSIIERTSFFGESFIHKSIGKLVGRHARLTGKAGFCDGSQDFVAELLSLSIGQ